MWELLGMTGTQDAYGDYIGSEYLLAYFEALSFSAYDWTLVFAVLFLIVELADDLVEKRMNKERAGETFSSIATQIPYYVSETVVFGGIVLLYFYLYTFIPWKLPETVTMAFIALILTDFVYYVEHRFMHNVRLFWLAHSVHHSSPVFNTATAFRFSIFDPVISGLFHLPLVLLGINPIFIFMGEILVQAYQFWIHNEVIGKLGPFEWVLNTPSHHRVHHGSDAKYIDKNFGGIFIVWDRLFGTFEEEDELPTYGLITPINTINPVKVQFYEFFRLWRDIRTARNAGEVLRYVFKGPGWKPQERDTGR